MKKIDTVRAFRDTEYRNSLSADQLAQLPAHPAGVASVTDDSLKTITGGCAPSTIGFSCVPPGYQCP